MKESQFAAQREPLWREYEASLSKGRQPEGVDVPSMYRSVSRDLAIARQRRYGPGLIERLNGLVLRGHQLMYQERRSFWRTALEFLAFGYPAMVRARWKRFAFCFLSFAIPFALLWYAGAHHPEWVVAVLPDEVMSSMDEMYSSSNFGEREADQGFRMFAHYIRNNVGIDFKVFAGGILAGIGSLLLLAYNALIIGGVFGYIEHVGHQANFYPFVSGHAAFELTGACLASLAGLELGFSWLMPGRKTRRYALVEGAKSGLMLLAGAATLTALAAVIEGFWSPSGASPQTKYWVGAFFWVVTAAYLGLAGRRRAA